GIGFFSVFMWGGRVKIVTRRIQDAARETRVLEFESGLATRPILRAADELERIQYGGTRVRVWLDPSIGGPGGILESFQRNHGRGISSFALLCAKVAATLDVNVCIELNGGS